MVGNDNLRNQLVPVNEQPYVVVFGTSVAANATRLDVDGLPGIQRRWADRSGASARASDCGEHKHDFEFLNGPITPIPNSVLGAVSFSLLFVGNGKPHSGNVRGNHFNWRVRLFDDVHQRHDVVRSLNRWL